MGASSAAALPDVEYQGRHMGHTKMDLLAEFQRALSLARKGEVQGDDYEFGLHLTTQNTRMRGVTLQNMDPSDPGAVVRA